MILQFFNYYFTIYNYYFTDDYTILHLLLYRWFYNLQVLFYRLFYNFKIIILLMILWLLFSCLGYYADPEMQCQGYHVCLQDPIRDIQQINKTKNILT